MWRPLVIAMVLALAPGSVVVYADKPNPDHDHGNDNGELTCDPGEKTIDICTSSFIFQPENLVLGPLPADEVVKWFNTGGTHNVSICPPGTFFDGNRKCQEGGRPKVDPIADSPGNFGEGQTLSFTFNDDSGFSGRLVSFFCKFHGKNKDMFGTVLVP